MSFPDKLFFHYNVVLGKQKGMGEMPLAVSSCEIVSGA